MENPDKTLLASTGASLMALTLGGKNACLLTRSGQVWLGRESVLVEVMDIVGAGDCFLAGLKMAGHSAAPAPACRKVSVLQMGQQDARGGHVGRTRHIVNIAGAHKGVDVRLVRLGGHGVAQKHYRVNLAGGQPCAYLQIATERTAQEAFHTQAHLRLQAAAGGACGDQAVLAQQRREVAGQGNHAVFHSIMSDQGDIHRGIQAP
jgi:hypothetical protein